MEAAVHLQSSPRCYLALDFPQHPRPPLRYPLVFSRFTRLVVPSRRPNSLRRKLLFPHPHSPLHSPSSPQSDPRFLDTEVATLFDSGVSESSSPLIPAKPSPSTSTASPPVSNAVVVPVRSLNVPSYLPPTFFGFGGLVLPGVFVLSVVTSLLTPGKKERQYTPMEKEMMRRKIKSREERAASPWAGVDICRDDFSTGMRPELNRDEVMDAVRLAKPTARLIENTTSVSPDVAGFDIKVEEIREMARQARESEDTRQSLGIEPFFQNMAKNSEQLPKSDQGLPVEEVVIAPCCGPKTDNDGSPDEMAGTDECGQPIARLYNCVPSKVGVVKVIASNIDLTDRGDTTLSLDSLSNKQEKENHRRRKPKIIRTVREAKVYLSNKHDRNLAGTESHISAPVESEINSQTFNNNKAISTDGIFSRRSSNTIGNSWETSSLLRNDSTGEGLVSSVPEYVSSTKSDFASSSLSEEPPCPDVGRSHTNDFSSKETALSSMSGNWMDKYSCEIRPILEKMGDGFRNSYISAREKASESLNLVSDLTQLQNSVGNAELEWMEDEKLREIVFQVRDNELAGRDPFYSMQAEDKQAFFEGLERKVEKENERLLNLHEYLHSNIENLDYGADGISIYDSLAKIIPRWKEPPVFTCTGFLSRTGEEKMTLVEDEEGKTLAGAENSTEVKERLPTYPTASTEVSSSLPVSNLQDTGNKKGSKKGKVVIEGSDGSIRTGKKSGKEYLEHTKKWSRGFLDSYSAETDPEIKSIMKDIGKDLDRWLTEKEIKEAAEIREKFLERNKQYVENKIKKLRKEVELFGPKAVVSKYREYAEEKEQDYLWWLDLPFVLCIELYSVEDGEQKVGFYSLEMAADLDLEPKPRHVIAFEDPGDCKNLCYIIQAHMEILQNGHAFVVPRPSKDVFRDAKANGFGVTVLRKGELKLNVDQLLEEVEEQISEVGSRIYYDNIMKEHAVDTSQLMAGVFGVSSKPRKRNTSKQTRKRITK
ncbi:hypothetical protein MLD38_039053 [Melastoma candidum]|uniref:Uncharacterized protein n=1 Tax=Melastoma candidum TaxID=119954 RepID=A0ACB9L276_9MYRT|nr:hypothetical protein MLD38_039053 [Melastoma candidum]